MKKKAVILWCEVSCTQCGAVIGLNYKNQKTIAVIKKAAKNWAEIDSYGTLCPDCQARLLN